MLLIIKIILLELAFELSGPAADNTQYFVHLSFNSTFKLINSISSDPQKLLKYFNGTAVAAFFKIPFISSATIFPYNLAWFLKDLKSLVFAILLL